MKKELTIFLLIINVFVFSPLINAGINSSIIGNTITGETTNANLAVSITISIGEPNLTIKIPKNHTYITSENLQLNFTSENVQTIWYNLDNQANTTITENTTFNTTQGQHTLYLYANNSDGNKTSANVTFTVNSNKFKVIYDEYIGNKKGSSTNFNKSSYEDLQNMQGIILENINYGKIKFNEVINTTNDINISDNKLDLDVNINISLNNIEVNTTQLPNFNKAATIWLYNLPFNNPRILIEGETCPVSICTFESFENIKLILLNSIDEAVELANKYSPEHLILSVKNLNTISKMIFNAGSVFLGNYSPESAGDYASGTNHTLPANGYANVYGGVSLDSFMKKITFQKINRNGLKDLGPVIETLAAAEGLEAHRRAVNIRLNNLKNI